MVFLSAWKLFFAGAAALFGFATLMDKLSSNELRSRLREMMIRDHSFRKMGLNEFTIFFIENTFGRFFIGNHLSVANLLKSLSTTVAALICIIFVYSIIYDTSPFYFFKFADSQPQNLKAIYIVIVVGTVILNDLTSVLQTAMFMRFASSIRSFTDMLFLGLCDLIITINLFVFIFPIAMTAIFEIDDATGRVVDLYVSSSILAEPKDSQAPKSKKRGATEKVSESENDAPNIRFANDASFGSDFKEFIKHNSLRVDEFQIEPYEMNFSGQKNSLSGTEIYMTSKGINSDEISNTLWKAFDIQLDNAQPPKAEDNLEEFLREGKTFKHGTLRLANGFHNHPNLNVYFAAYAQSHVVQDQFLAIPFLRIAEQSIRGLMIRFSPTEMDIPYKKAKEFIFLCDSKLIFEDSIPNVSECTTYALAYIGPALRHIYYWSRISNPPVGPIMVSVFASTGLFLAMLFYASLALYVLSAVTLRTTWILGVGRGWFDLEKNPFAVSAGIIIVTVLPMGLILGQVVSMILEPH